MIDTSQMASMARIALNYCRLGATDAQLAEFFDVSPETLGGWLADRPEFAAAVRRGRKMADAEVIDSFHQLATGYVETVENVVIGDDGPMVVSTRKQHRPDYKAGVTWLCNRMPEDWKWPGARRQTADEIVADAADLFALPLLAEEQDETVPDPVVPTGARSPERRELLSASSGSSWREGPCLPLRRACPESSRGGRDDEAAECALGLQPPPQRVLVAA